MGTGIIICGLNGAGKSTLGRALAEKLDFHFIDIEELFFTGADPDHPYTNPRPRREAEGLLSGRTTPVEENAELLKASFQAAVGPGNVCLL